MKVLVVGPDRQDPGGVANYYNAVFPKLSNETVVTHYLAIGSTHSQIRGLHIVFDQLRFWQTITRFKPDIIHLNPSLDLKSFLRDGVFIFLAKQRSKPVVVFFRGWQLPFETVVSGHLNWFFKSTYKKADAFIVLANAFSDRLSKWGIDVPIYLANTAVANELLEGFSIDRKLSEIPTTDIIRLLYLARLEKKKGVLELLEAVRILLEKGIDISLTIAGDGPVMSEVRNQVENSELLGKRVSIVGYVRGQAKIEILRTHQVYCFPTQYGEGMPNSVLEAMAFGMAIVTCPVGGIADFFENERMGVLLETTDPQKISDSIATLIDNRGRLINIARYNFEYAQTHFLASSAADNLRSIYKEILNAVNAKLKTQNSK
ncbi:MAG: glycosyltransferase family 4 protein [Methylococcaceae bacterium]|nr:glycosyltransferase family 4 protein [Methylococcaceae bacterium]